MEKIFTGNIVTPDSVSIPTVQAPLRPDQPIVYGRGQAFSVYVKYPVGTKRLLFTINDRDFSTSPPLFQQVVFPDPKEGGIAEFFVDTATTLRFSAGLYYWDVFQLRDDGTRDIWSPYNKGTFSMVDFPSSNYIEIQQSGTDDIYNNPDAYDGRNVTLVAYKDEDWEANIKLSVDDEIKDLSGYSAYLPLKPDQFGNTIAAELTTENDGIILDPINGIIKLVFEASFLNLLDSITYYYYLELTKAGASSKLIGGNFIVREPE